MSEHFNDEQLAIDGHEIVRAMKLANGEPDPGAFYDAPAWMRESSRERVRAIKNGASVEPEAEHMRWMEEKKDKGYVYGKVRNDDPGAGPLTHPLLVPFSELGTIDQLKDSIPNTVIHELP